MDNWISAKINPPNKDEIIVASFRHKKERYVKIASAALIESFGFKVTHWMPVIALKLPRPPE